MKSLSTRILEKLVEPEIYHKSYGSAINAVEKYATFRGVTIDQDEYSNAYTDGFFKPSEGKVKKDSFQIFKNGKEQKKMLHVQIYRMNATTFEFNAYIN